MFVMSEFVVEKMFRLWMVRKKVVQQLNWIYINECHVMLNNELIKFSKSADNVVDGYITAQLWEQVMKINKLKEVASINVLSFYELN